MGSKIVLQFHSTNGCIAAQSMLDTGYVGLSEKQWRFKMNKILFVVIACTFVALPANADIIYNEAVDGDLDAVGTTNVTLVEGLNEILGSLNATPPSDTDRITFTQTALMVVDSIVLEFGTVSGYPILDPSISSDLHNSVANLFDDNLSQSTITSRDSISASFFDSFGPETGPLSQDTEGAIWDFQLSGNFIYPAQPWTLSINTTVVPVPSAFILAAIGLGCAGHRLRKRKAA